MKTVVLALVTSLLVAGCAGVDERGSAQATGMEVPAAAGSATSCPVTVPTPGFVPPEPYPSEPPLGQVWYGTRGLWTLLDPEPVIWRLGSLPVDEGMVGDRTEWDGPPLPNLDALPVDEEMVGDRTLWFSEGFSTAADEDFSGDPSITLTATRLDAPAPVVRYDHGVPSFDEGIKNFLLVGLELPAEPGCWRVTATYHGAELTYVLEVR